MSTPISALLGPQRIRIGLAVQSKKKLLEEMASLLAAGDDDETRHAVLFKEMCQREQLGSTGIGNGVALPHCRLPGLSAPLGAIIILCQPLPYEASDAQPVSLVFGLAVPVDAASEHLAILAQLAKLFRDTQLCARLMRCTDAQSLQRTLAEYEKAAGESTEDVHNHAGHG